MTKEDIYLFYRGPFSQWHRCEFEVNGVAFNCAEQYMMYHKALAFGDSAGTRRILAANTPREQKSLGRSVSGFDEKKWEALREGIVFSGNYAKFAQNGPLKEALFATGHRLLAEAAPRDKIWGIGLSEDDPRAYDVLEWRGLNLLGFALTRVREVLRWEQRVVLHPLSRLRVT